MSEPTEEMRLRRQLAAFPIEVQCADVCAGCGLHMFSDLGERLRWLVEGGTVQCEACKKVKVREK